MKKVLVGFLALVVVVGVVFALGPRVTVDTTIQKQKLPGLAGLEMFFQTAEKRVKDLRPNCEKKIIWADPSRKEKTAISFVYLHGFSASRREASPFAERLAAHYRANLFFTRLRGHGRTGEALAEATVHEWLNDTVEAIRVGRLLGDKVVVVATSTGATLGMWLAAQPEGQDISALVLFSPNLYPRNSQARFLLWPWGNVFLRLAAGKERKWKATNAEQAKYWTNRYPSKALLQMMGAVDLIDRTDFSKIKQPLFLAYSPKDPVVSGAKVEERFPSIGSRVKELVAVPGSKKNESNHVLVGDIRAPSRTQPMLQKVMRFLRPILGEQPSSRPAPSTRPAPR